MAIAALVLGIIAVPLFWIAVVGVLAVVFGAVALSRVGRNGRAGRGLAVVIGRHPIQFRHGRRGLLVLGFGWLDGRRSRPTPAAWWLLRTLFWLLLQMLFVYTGAIAFAMLTIAAYGGDTWALIVEGLLAVGVVLALAGGWMLRPVSAV